MNKVTKRQPRGEYHCKICQSSDLHDRPSQHWINCAGHEGTYSLKHFVRCNRVDECLHCELRFKGKNSHFVDHDLFLDLGSVQAKRWNSHFVDLGLKELPDCEIDIPKFVGAIIAEPPELTIDVDSFPVVLQKLHPEVPVPAKNSHLVGRQNGDTNDDDRSNDELLLFKGNLSPIDDDYSLEGLEGFVATKRARLA